MLKLNGFLMTGLLTISLKTLAIPTTNTEVTELSEALSDSKVCIVSYWGWSTDTVIYSKGLIEYNVVTLSEDMKIGQENLDLIIKHCYNDIQAT